MMSAGFPVSLQVTSVFTKKIKRLFKRPTMKYYAEVKLQPVNEWWYMIDSNDVPTYYVEIPEIMYHRILIQRDNKIKDKRI